MTQTSRELALLLLHDYADEMAAAIVQQRKTTVPGLNVLDDNASLRNAKMLMRTLHQSLLTRCATETIEMAADLVALRTASGVDIRQLVAVSHCYLPMIRRVMTARAEQPIAGLRAFEEIEAETLGIVVASVIRVMPAVVDFDDFPSIDDEDEIVTEPDGLRIRFTLSPFSEL